MCSTEGHCQQDEDFEKHFAGVAASHLGILGHDRNHLPASRGNVNKRGIRERYSAHEQDLPSHVK